MDPWTCFLLAMAVAIGFRVGSVVLDVLFHLVVFAFVCTFFGDEGRDADL